MPDEAARSRRDAAEEHLRESKYKFYKPTTWFHAPKTATYLTYQPNRSQETPNKDAPGGSPQRARSDVCDELYSSVTDSTGNPAPSRGGEGGPPSGIVWVWLGAFKRWGKRHVSAETPGLLTFYRHSRGSARKAWTLSLEGSSVMFDTSHSRQFAVRSTVGTVYLRALHAKQRNEWVHQLKTSTDVYARMIVQATTGMERLMNPEAVTAQTTTMIRSVQELVKGSTDRLQASWYAMDAAIGIRQQGPSSAAVLRSSQRMYTARSEDLANVNNAAADLTARSTPYHEPYHERPSDECDPRMMTPNPSNFGLHQPQSPSYPDSSSGSVLSQITGTPREAAAPGSAAPTPAYPLEGSSSLPSEASVGLGAAQVPSLVSRSGPAGRPAAAAKPPPASPSAARKGGLAGAKPVVPALPMHTSPDGLSFQSVSPSAGGRPSRSGTLGAQLQSIWAGPGPGRDGVSPRGGLSPRSHRSLDEAGTQLQCRTGQAPSEHWPAARVAQLAEMWAWVQQDTLAVLEQNAQRIVELETEASALEKALEANGGKESARHRTVGDPYYESDESFMTARNSLTGLQSFSEALSSHESLSPGASAAMPLGDASTSAGYPFSPAQGSAGDTTRLDQETQHALLTVQRVRQLSHSVGRHAAVERMAALKDSAPTMFEAAPRDDAGPSDTVSLLSSSSDEDDATAEVGTSRGVRTRLPNLAPLSTGISIWGILKNAIGKDLTKITLPATINEPLSGLQRFAEELEQVQYLELASQSAQPLMRALYVAMFTAVPNNSIVLRDRKPFNPLLGETFEWTAPDGAHKALVEQVSHHPPIACMHAQGAAYTLDVELLMTPSFWGKSVTISPSGGLTARLTKWNESYVWNKPGVQMNNIILGRPWLEVTGTMNLTCDAGPTAEVTLQKCKGRLPNRGELTGKVLAADGSVAFTLAGSIMGTISATPVSAAAAQQSGWPQGEPRQVYERLPPAPDSQVQFNMTAFAMTMNDPNDPCLQDAAPTDSRRKPDQRALENADYEAATSEKFRLEDKQRAAARERKARGEPWKTVWFDKAPNAKALVKEDGSTSHVWNWNGEYWRAREAHDWSRCPDIY